MKTIREYKDEFIKLMQELEKEHGCFVKSINIEQFEHIDYTKTTCKIDIQ